MVTKVIGDVMGATVLCCELSATLSSADARCPARATTHCIMHIILILGPHGGGRQRIPDTRLSSAVVKESLK